MPNLIERAVNVVSPRKANEMYQKRLARIQMNYGNHGASVRKNFALGWLTRLGDAATDIDSNAAKLRERSRDLDAGGGVSRGATRTLRTNVIGAGMIPKPKINFAYLGMSEEAAQEWESKTLHEFKLWAESTMCDNKRTQNFYKLQQLAFLSMLISGDVLVLLPSVAHQGEPYDIKIRLIEADRLTSPNANGRYSNELLQNGGRIINGVEFNKAGEVVAYHIANEHPGGVHAGDMQTVRIEAYGKYTGLANVLHIADFERPEQTRGIPYVSPAIEHIKQLDRYIGSELAANIVASMLTVFLEQEQDSGSFPLADAVSEEEKVTDDDSKIELAPGAIYKLPAGVKATTVNPMRTNSAYADYVDSLFTTIGTTLEIPKEVLIKKFDSNYSASRAALLEFWKVVLMNRANFIRAFCQPIYEIWLAEAVAKGRIEAPHFFEDYGIRKAYCNCNWIGSSMGVIDPLKEVRASAEKIANGLSTSEREAAELNGSSWAENIVQRKKEMKAMAEITKELGTLEEEL